jgi:transposase
MMYGAIDLHLRHSEIRIVDAEGRVVREKRVVTGRETLTSAFAGLGPLRILLETGTESEWVAQTLEAASHTVVVADANYAPMYGEVRRRVKTDRRDVAALAEANRRGWYRATHRRSAAQRALQQILRSRRQLVSQRTGTISVVRALLRQEGYRLPSGSAAQVPARVARLSVPAPLTATLDPLLRVIDTLTREVATIDGRLTALSAGDAVVRQLQTVPGVGPVVAQTFRATLDRIDRFRHAGQVSALVGLVPREDSSAERRHRGHITKSGSGELRSLLIQAAWACWRSTGSGALRAWAEQLAARRGRRIAVVALARRLSRILYAVWRDDAPFDGTRIARA